MKYNLFPYYCCFFDVFVNQIASQKSKSRTINVPALLFNMAIEKLF